MSTEADVVRPLELGAVDVRTRSYPARAVQWNGTPEHAELVIEWIVSLGNSKAELVDGGVDEDWIQIANPSGTRARLYPGYWVVQDADGWHEPLPPEQYDELYVEAGDRTAAAKPTVQVGEFETAVARTIYQREGCTLSHAEALAAAILSDLCIADVVATAAPPVIAEGSCAGGC